MSVSSKLEPGPSADMHARMHPPSVRYLAAAVYHLYTSLFRVSVQDLELGYTSEASRMLDIWTGFWKIHYQEGSTRGGTAHPSMLAERSAAIASGAGSVHVAGGKAKRASRVPSGCTLAVLYCTGSALTFDRWATFAFWAPANVHPSHAALRLALTFGRPGDVQPARRCDHRTPWIHA